jgi:hypothetical protein
MTLPRSSRRIDEVSIYYNEQADIVIRQKDPMGNDDGVVIVPFGHLKAVIKRLQELSKNRPAPDQQE